MRELSVFVDESGGQEGISKYCLITLVFHDQGESLEEQTLAYERSLCAKQLPDVPFHASPLIYGKGDYRHMTMAERKRLLAAFFVFMRALPIRYKTFVYRRSEIVDTSAFVARLRRDLVVFLADNLSFFQSFDKVKIYYDNGQQMITEALHRAIDYELSKEAVLYRKAYPEDYRLFQVADFLCTIELTAVKFANGEPTNSDTKMFGSVQTFKRNYLKQVRRKAMDRS